MPTLRAPTFGFSSPTQCKGNNRVPYEIREVPPRPCVFIRRRIKQDALGEFFMEAMPKVFGFAFQNGGPAGPPFARYPEWGVDDCVVEAGVTTNAPVAAEGEITSGTFGGCKAIVTVHVGPYDGLKQAFYKLAEYAEQNGHPRRVPFEVYIDDPGSKPEAELRSELYWPID